MDTSRFRDDVMRIPETLGGLADALGEGLPGLDLLPPAGRLLVVGMGSSAFAATTIAREARMHGLDVSADLASATLLPPAADDLVVVAVSASGSSAEVLAAIEPYRGTGRLVAVTNALSSPLAQRSDVVLPLLAEEEVSGVSCRTFRHTLVVLAAMLECYGAPFRATTMASAGATATAHLLDGHGEWIVDVADTLLGPSGTFVLAPADRLSSAQQAALMMREVPRRPAYASETGDWSHVDVYLTKTLDYRALLFAGSTWDAAAIEWMRERGATLVSVGADHDVARHVIRYPGDDDRLVAIVSELLVAELVAASWYAADPTFAWSGRS